MQALSDDKPCPDRGASQTLAQGETEDDILIDAFATVREAAKRTLGQRHFDVQLGRLYCMKVAYGNENR